MSQFDNAKLKTDSLIRLASQTVRILPGLEADDAKSILCFRGKYSRWFQVSMSFYYSDYRLSNLGNRFFLEIVGHKATRTSIQRYFDEVSQGCAGAFISLEFSEMNAADYAFKMIRFIPAVSEFLISKPPAGN